MSSLETAQSSQIFICRSHSLAFHFVTRLNNKHWCQWQKLHRIEVSCMGWFCCVHVLRQTGSADQKQWGWNLWGKWQWSQPCDSQCIKLHVEWNEESIRCLNLLWTTSVQRFPIDVELAPLHLTWQVNWLALSSAHDRFHARVAGICWDLWHPSIWHGDFPWQFLSILYQSVLPVGQLLVNKNAFTICILHQCKLPNASKVEIPCCHGEHFDAKVPPIQKRIRSKSQGAHAHPAKCLKFFNHSIEKYPFLVLQTCFLWVEMSCHFNLFFPMVSHHLSLLHFSFWLRGYPTMAIMLSFMALWSFSVCVKSARLLQQCLQKLTALFSIQNCGSALEASGARMLQAENCHRNCPFPHSDSDKWSQEDYLTQAREQLWSFQRCQCFWCAFSNVWSFFVTANTQQSNKTKRLTIKIIPAHWHTQKDTNKAFVNSSEHLDSSFHWLIVMHMQQNGQRKCRQMKKHHFWLRPFGEWINHCNGFQNTGKSTNKPSSSK